MPQFKCKLVIDARHLVKEMTVTLDGITIIIRSEDGFHLVDAILDIPQLCTRHVLVFRGFVLDFDIVIPDWGAVTVNRWKF